MDPIRGFAITLYGMLLSALILMAAVGVTRPSTEVVMVLIIFHVAVLVLFFGAFRFPIALILIAAILLRFLFLYLDQFTSIPVFSSGIDTENFYNTALTIYENPGLLNESLFGGLFPKVAAMFFWLVGPERLLFQYFNALLGVASLILIAMAATRLEISQKFISPVLFICAVMPISASISSIFLREALITFLVALSVYLFCSWVVKPQLIFAIGALIAISFAGAFHLGVFGIALGYIVAFLIYDQKSGAFLFTFRRLLGMVPVLVGFVYLIGSFSGIFLQKLDKFSSTTDILESSTSSRGSSAYLPGAEINSPIEFVLFGGFKALLLLVSPPPWGWRSVLDIASFAFDGLFFLIALLVLVLGYRTLKGAMLKYPNAGRRKRILALLVLGIVAASLILGSGTSNSGTALRHRQKLVPIIAVSAMFALQERRRKYDSEEVDHYGNSQVSESVLLRKNESLL